MTDVWQDRAACRNTVLGKNPVITSEDNDLFFKAELAPQAIETYCSSCPVRLECRTELTIVPSKQGVWAGKFHGVNSTRGRPTVNKSLDIEARMRRHTAGMCDRELAGWEGIATTTITTWRKRAGLKPNPDVDWLAAKRLLNDRRHEMYQQGMSDTEIGQATGTSRAAIRSWRQKRRLPIN